MLYKWYDGKKYRGNKKTEAIFIKWKSIDNAVNMRKNKLTLVQYETIPYIWHDLVQLGVGRTISPEVADWFKKQDCKVQMNSDGINYIIMI